MNEVNLKLNFKVLIQKFLIKNSQLCLRVMTFKYQLRLCNKKKNYLIRKYMQFDMYKVIFPYPFYFTCLTFRIK